MAPFWGGTVRILCSVPKSKEATNDRDCSSCSAFLTPTAPRLGAEETQHKRGWQSQLPKLPLLQPVPKPRKFQELSRSPGGLQGAGASCAWDKRPGRRAPLPNRCELQGQQLCRSPRGAPRQAQTAARCSWREIAGKKGLASLGFQKRTVCTPLDLGTWDF